MMKIKQVIAILENEMDCVKRGNICDRNCSNCELVKTDIEILTAYEKAIEILNDLDEKVLIN